MKKLLIIFIIICITMICFTSCAKEKKAWSQAASYKDPQMIGGYWDVTMQTGQVFYHVKCTYWGTSDDTAVFEMDDGTIICQSGACVCIKSRQKVLLYEIR